MSRYVVTGGAGFIGSHVVDLLIEEGHGVVVVDNLSSGKEKHLNRKAVFKEIDIVDFDALRVLFTETSFDGVFHLAAIPRMQYSILHPARTFQANVVGTQNVLEAARLSGVRRVVYSASSSAYGTNNQLPFREDMRANPVIPYAWQKYVGELNCRSYGTFQGVETVSLRYFNVYGPRQTTDQDGPYATVIGIFLGLREHGLPMPIVGDGHQRRDFTHVSDVARANYAAMRSIDVGRGEVLNIGTQRNHSVLDVAQRIGGSYEFVPERLGEARETLADNQKAAELIGWRPYMAFEDGIDELKKLHGIR